MIAGRDCYRDSVTLHSMVSYLPGDVRLFRNMKGHEVLSFLRIFAGHATTLVAFNAPSG